MKKSLDYNDIVLDLEKDVVGEFLDQSPMIRSDHAEECRAATYQLDYLIDGSAKPQCCAWVLRLIPIAGGFKVLFELLVKPDPHAPQTFSLI